MRRPSMPPMVPRSPYCIVAMLLAFALGGCAGTQSEPMRVSDGPASDITGSISSPVPGYRARAAQFDRSLTAAEKDATIADLRREVARHRATRRGVARH